MNIALVSPLRLDGKGGIVTIVRSLHSSLSEKGHNVVTLVAGDTDTVRPINRPDWPDVYGIYLRSPFIPQARLKGFVAFWVYLPVTLYALARFLRERRIDIVHNQFVSPGLFYFALLRRSAQWKFIVSFQGSDMNNFTSHSRSFQLCIRSILRRADAVTACSGSILEKLKAVAANGQAKYILVPNANPLSDAPNLEPAPLPELGDFILSVGSLIHRKGHDLVIRAIRLARDRGRTLQLLIVGTGQDEQSLRSLAQEVGVSAQVQFVGDVDHHLIGAYYARCRFVVLASRAEGLPLALMEAMAYRRAVVATRVDGIPEIVRDGVSGLLVPAEDVATLADALIRLDQDPLLRDALAGRGAEFVRQYHTWESYTEKNIATYQAALHAR